MFSRPRRPTDSTTATRDTTRSPLLRRLDPALSLVVLLLVSNLLAVAWIAVARQDARGAVGAGLALETRADARTLEALLAREHARLDFLARTPPLADPVPGGDDPVARRWARLDLEATLLLYLASSPSVTRLQVVGTPREEGLQDEAVRGENGAVRVLARRQDDVPTLTTPAAAPPPAPELLHASWPLAAGAGRLDAWVDADVLLADLGPGLRLHRESPVRRRESMHDVPVERIESALWSPPLDAWLERTRGDSETLDAIDRLGERYRAVLLLNVALLPVSLLLGILTLRRVRRVARLETERRQQARLRELQHQVQHAERLSSLGRFAAGIAHEINNPLEGMANYLQLLRDDLDAESADADPLGGERLRAARRWTERLGEGIERAAGTVRQILHFAEPGHRRRETMEVAPLLESTVSFLRGHPDCAAADLLVDCPPRLTVLGDPVSLGQLVLNLVLNACQSRDDGGTVRVEAHAVDGAAEPTLELRVLDRGPGLAPEIADHAFEPFRSTRGSSGLGLAVCHDIVTEHGGTIELAPRHPGPGTIARVRLPAAPAREPTSRPHEPPR